MRRAISWAIGWLALAGVAAAASPAPWADPGLSVRDGLVVWLDASAQPAARKANGSPPLVSGQAIDQWLDASGHARHVRQQNAADHPSFRAEGPLGFVRFSGRGPHLISGDVGLDLREATLFVVAAPLHNEGTFRGMFGFHKTGEADFVTGFNIDQGPWPTSRFEAVNVESAGAGGQKNLRTKNGPFLELRRLCVTSTVGPEGIALYVDGEREGARDRAESTMRADRLVVGGRYTGGLEDVKCFYGGELAEVILYDRVLGDDERKAVDAYLAAKYEKAGPTPPPTYVPGQRLLESVKNPPPVQMFVPGFVVRELPVKLSNINNVLYRDDGVLVALAYDGNVYLLRDSDGDGLEDDAQLFWENEGRLRAPIGMALTPPDYARGRGVFVPSKSKLSLLVDADGDDRADEEVIVAQGWRELWTQVDALGVAVDPRDHAVYFGLGTWNFTNGHQVNDQGVAEYKLTDEHGTILRVAPDFKSREIVCTGIRFPVAMRFAKDGELFATDQEGATWLPNGNPYDELLHIERGRHYGFPPRHPRHLPDVIDEPSVFDYRPQHQSTCGLNFNEPAADGGLFGPEWWQHDAIVTGSSRGKLYRTKLVRTAAGYVAQNQLLGAANMLTIDACVGPGRSMVVAMHSGGPDWGSGPSGEGKLFKVTYADAAAPQPTLVWAASPREVRVAFDRPLDPELLKELAKRVQIDGGEFVGAGDRFESLRPGYAVVERQVSAPRFGVDVQNVTVTGDGRTLIIPTAPQYSAVSYSLSLPGLAPPPQYAPDGAVPQHPDVELQYDLSGVEASWRPADDGAAWNGWLPHLETRVAREFTRASAEHQAAWKATEGRGELVLSTAVDLRGMLRPDVQPGTKIDHEWPAEQVTLVFKTTCRLEATVDGQPAPLEPRDGAYVLALPAGANEPRQLQLTLRHDEADEPLELSVHYYTAEDARPRALALRRFRLPWARPADAPPTIVENSELPELKGGDWLRGQREFFGSQAACSKCHAVRGVGGKSAPDLSNLPLRDYASVLRDVTQPSFAINPDFTTQKVLTADGLVLSGAVRVQGDDLIVADAEGKETRVARADVESLEHSPQSIMPEGIPKLLGPDRLRDLMTFLLVAPPSMPVYGDLPPPPPRRLADVEVVLAGSADPPEKKRKLNVVLVSGPKDHGPGEHDYPAWREQWRRLLALDDSVTVSTAENWPSADQLAAADALVFYQKGEWTPERARDLDGFLQRGGGASYIHYAVDGGNDAAGFARRIGLAWEGGRSKFRHGPLDLDFAAGRDHPIARNFAKVHFYDESYWQPVGDPKRISLLATGVEDGQPQPLFWTLEHERGRVFVSIPGHYMWTFDDPLFRTLVLRGLAWSAGEPVDRFNDLVLPGARVRAADDEP
jgi:putative heme-binding domain-containing protein